MKIPINDKRLIPKQALLSFALFLIFICNVLAPSALKSRRLYFPNLEELSFIIVCAFPKASSNGLTCKMVTNSTD